MVFMKIPEFIDDSSKRILSNNNDNVAYVHKLV